GNKSKAHLLKSTRPLILFLLLLTISCFSQVRSKYASRKIAHYHSYYKHHYYHFSSNRNFDGDFDQGDWILYGIGSQHSFDHSAIQNTYGLSAEYFFADNWSLRGGIMINTDYWRLTPAPLGVLALKGAADADVHAHHEHLIAALISLAMNDGIC